MVFSEDPELLAGSRSRPDFIGLLAAGAAVALLVSLFLPWAWALDPSRGEEPTIGLALPFMHPPVVLALAGVGILVGLGRSIVRERRSARSLSYGLAAIAGMSYLLVVAMLMEDDPLIGVELEGLRPLLLGGDGLWLGLGASGTLAALSGALVERSRAGI